MSSNNKQRAFVLLSGGIDSTTCLALAKRDFDVVRTFSFDYGQRHRRELEAARAISTFYEGAAHYILSLGPQPISNLTDKNADIPKVTYAELGEGKSPSYHHFRNGQFLSTATAYASSMLREDELGTLYVGVHAEDAQNWAYADCTPEFVGAMANAIFIGTYQKVRLKAPLLEMRKDEIIRLGWSLNAPYDLSWSCYLGGEKHCGLCPTCRARKAGFQKAGVEDPTDYVE